MANHHHENNGFRQEEVAVIMVPLPIQGHLNQLLHLSRLISAYNLPVHFIGTTTHNRQAKLRVQGWDPLSISNLHFHEFPTPPFLSPPPNPNSTIKFPSHLQPLFEASTQLREPVGQLLRKLSPTVRRLVIIHDSLMASVVQDFVSLPNAESYTFHCVSACAIFFFKWENMGRPAFRFKQEIFPEDDDNLPSFEGCFTSKFKKFTAVQYEYAKFNSGRIYNSCRAIEEPFLDLLGKEKKWKNQKQWALGPFNPVQHRNGYSHHKCLQWLHKQDSNSVIFVSFGTTTTFPDEQIKELAVGLEKSGHKFIWVLRDADKGDVFGENHNLRRVELPQGYEERVEREGIGMVVREWAPQLEILGHRSTGGFLSHCGWNSCMESISMGVPVAAWPMHSDQPSNSVLITRVLKVGLVVREWQGGGGDSTELVTSSVVEKVVRRLMGSEEGAEIRKRAVELGGVVRKSVADQGGVTRLEIRSFIAHITR